MKGKTSSWKYAYIGIFSIVIFLLAGFGYYKWVYQVGPVQSLVKAGAAVEKHDVQAFHEYVDVKRIAGTYLDAEFARTRNHQNNPIAKALWSAMREIAIETVDQAVNEAIEGKSMPEASHEESPLASVASENILNYKAYRIIETKTDMHMDDTATVTVHMYDEKRKKNYILELLMQKKSKDVWQVIAIPNLNVYLADIFAK